MLFKRNKKNKTPNPEVSPATPLNIDEKVCLNCATRLNTNDKFCQNCGQKHSTKRITLLHLFSDFIDNVFNIDSKFFKSIGALLSPGKLSIDYFKGKHQRYVTPSRIFFVAGIVHFSILSIVLKDNINILSDQDDKRKLAQSISFKHDLDTAKIKVLEVYKDNENVASALDTLYDAINWSKVDNDTSNYVGYLSFTKQDKFKFKQVFLTEEEQFSDDLEAVAISHGVTERWDKLLFKQVLRISNSEGNFGNFILGNLIWMVIFMMPALALVLKLLYIRRNKYFVEHLVFVFNYHAFAFWWISILLLFLHLTEGWEMSNLPLLITIFVASVFVYLFIAMKRVYQQSKFKTFVKFIGLNIGYAFILAVFLALTFGTSMLFY